MITWTGTENEEAMLAVKQEAIDLQYISRTEDIISTYAKQLKRAGTSCFFYNGLSVDETDATTLADLSDIDRIKLAVRS